MGNVTESCSCRKGSVPADQSVKSIRRPPRVQPRKLDWSDAAAAHWNFPEISFDGRYTHIPGREPKIEEAVGSPIEDGIKLLKSRPDDYEAVFYQTNMAEWPASDQRYNLVKRTGSGFKVKAKGSQFTFISGHYHKLSQEARIHPDAYTDSVLATHRKKRLGSAISPGRGQGCADVPSLKLMGEIEPSDVSQGALGNCWLLSALSAMAEFHGAVERLFRKTDKWKEMPRHEANYYTVTLYDLNIWQEVDVTVDERLCTRPVGKHLLGAHPSMDGELWVCYIEKAVAAHCGGWDKIDGGTSVHAWRLLTGCREVYTITMEGQLWGCYGSKNANTGEWESLSNSPHDGFRGLWPMPWPTVGGGGSEPITSADLFRRMTVWHASHYIMTAGSIRGSDKNDHHGIVDGHAYTVLDIRVDVAGTATNMVQMRNPWGHKEFDGGAWVDDGDGWREHPEIREELRPANADDGAFWMDESEFFQYFCDVYLCAHNMTKFCQSC